MRWFAEGRANEYLLVEAHFVDLVDSTVSSIVQAIHVIARRIARSAAQAPFFMVRVVALEARAVDCVKVCFILGRCNGPCTTGWGARSAKWLEHGPDLFAVFALLIWSIFAFWLGDPYAAERVEENARGVRRGLRRRPAW